MYLTYSVVRTNAREIVSQIARNTHCKHFFDLFSLALHYIFLVKIQERLDRFDIVFLEILLCMWLGFAFGKDPTANSPRILLVSSLDKSDKKLTPSFS